MPPVLLKARLPLVVMPSTLSTVPTLNALKNMANGQATKIIFPFELSQLIRQGAKFLGATEETSEEIVGRPVMDESILGDMPQREEVNAILKEIKDAVPKVSVDELKDTSKRKLAIDAEKEENAVPPAA